MIPLDLLFALSPTFLLAGLWLADRIRRPRRLNRHQLLKLLADTKRPYRRRVVRLRADADYQAGLL